jgi:hypothetical protein
LWLGELGRLFPWNQPHREDRRSVGPYAYDEDIHALMFAAWSKSDGEPSVAIAPKHSQYAGSFKIKFLLEPDANFSFYSPKGYGGDTGPDFYRIKPEDLEPEDDEGGPAIIDYDDGQNLVPVNYFSLIDYGEVVRDDIVYTLFNTGRLYQKLQPYIDWLRS